MKDLSLKRWGGVVVVVAAAAAHAFNSSTWQAEAGRSLNLRQPRLHKETLSGKNKKTNKKEREDTERPLPSSCTLMHADTSSFLT